MQLMTNLKMRQFGSCLRIKILDANARRFSLAPARVAIGICAEVCYRLANCPAPRLCQQRRTSRKKLVKSAKINGLKVVSCL